MNRQGQEVNALLVTVLAVVLALVLLSVIVYFATEGNVFRGDNNICEMTNGFIRGCS